MSYQALARKWRPRNFSELVGQPHVVNALSHQLKTNTLHHAYLFTGTRGVGKTTIARLLAKSLNCTTNGISANPCCECENCRDLDAGKFIDLIEVDAASRTGVDDTRDLIESVSYLPAKGSHKVYLIDEVHMFSKSSFNALLKTLEEPPPYVKFVLATTDPEKLPVTILSRCLQFNLKRYSEQAVFDHLKHICTQEGIEFEPMALHALAKAGGGSMRDTLSLTDQALAFGQGTLRIKEVTMLLGTVHPSDIDQIVLALLTRDADRLFAALQKMTEFEVDCEQLMVSILTRIRQLSWLAEGVDGSLNVADKESTHTQKWLHSLSSAHRHTLLQLWYDIGQKSLSAMPRNHDQFGLLEMTLLRMLAFTPTDAINQQAKTELLTHSPIISGSTDLPESADLEESKISNTEPVAEAVEAVSDAKVIEEDVEHNSADVSVHESISTAPQTSNTESTKSSQADAMVEKHHDADDKATTEITGDHVTEQHAASSLVDAEAAFVENNGIELSPNVLSEVSSPASPVSTAVSAETESVTRVTETLTERDVDNNREQVSASERARITENVPSENVLAENVADEHEHIASTSAAEAVHLSEWATLVKSLGLGAYEQAIAEAGELTWQSPQHAVFKCSDTQASEVDAIKATLSQSLSAFAQQDITLAVEVVGDADLADAPARTQQALATAEKQAITEAFFQHPVVADIMTNLNAKVAADEITILNHFDE